MRFPPRLFAEYKQEEREMWKNKTKTVKSFTEEQVSVWNAAPTHTGM
jgi:hypothetical protein